MNRYICDNTLICSSLPPLSQVQNQSKFLGSDQWKNFTDHSRQRASNFFCRRKFDLRSTRSTNNNRPFSISEWKVWSSVTEFFLVLSVRTRDYIRFCYTLSNTRLWNWIIENSCVTRFLRTAWISFLTRTFTLGGERISRLPSCSRYSFYFSIIVVFVRRIVSIIL